MFQTFNISNDLLAILESVPDPEIPVLNVIDLGVIRDVQVEGKEVTIKLTPTYSGCPAMDVIGDDLPLDETADKDVLLNNKKLVRCTNCGSQNTKLVSQFGSTACKAMFQCEDCLEPFDYFKCLK